jgi:two-component system, response regulator YesN
MYSVMLVDDDYPVLELLSEAIDWEAIGLRLHSVHENGSSAWESAQHHMPDILITDIGMPKMDGLELIRRMKELQPVLPVAILSCHSEFHYAQLAMKLNVQDYILKDTLVPEDMQQLLLQFRSHLEQVNDDRQRQVHLRQMVDRSRFAMKEKLIRDTVHQPIIHPEEWQEEIQRFGLPSFGYESGFQCLPVIGYLDDYRTAKRRFMSDDILRFAVDNVLEEVIVNFTAETAVFSYGMKEWFLLMAYRPSLKLNIFDEAASCVGQIQYALRKSLKQQMSFVIGDPCSSPLELKKELTRLLAGRKQRFYAKKSSIAKKMMMSESEADLFQRYDEAVAQFRELVIRKESHAVAETVIRWTDVWREKEYAPELVKDWSLKLVLDVKLKLVTFQQYRTASNQAESLYKEISELDSLDELRDWMIEYILKVIEAMRHNREASYRKEVVEAIRYVSLHLDQKIGLEEIASYLHLNSSYFSRLFKRETGETFIEYITRVKMDRAKELLDGTSHSIGKICEMLGYDNQSYFIKTFKALAGMTPLEYRGAGHEGRTGKTNESH